MNDTGNGKVTRVRSHTSARIIGIVVFIVTAGMVSWATPDGNLVVTLVPALTAGLMAFGVARWWLRRAGSK